MDTLETPLSIVKTAILHAKLAILAKLIVLPATPWEHIPT